MLRTLSMNVDSKGNTALYSIREAKAVFPIPPASCFEHHFQWMCQFGGWCQPGLADFKASLHHCEYFVSVFYMQDQNDESCLVLLWSRKDGLGSRFRDNFTNFLLFFFFLCCVFTHSLTWSTSIHHCHSQQILHSSPLAPLENIMGVCSVTQSRPTLWPMCSSVHGIPQARVMEWVAISFSRGAFPPRYWQELLGDWGSGQVCSLCKKFKPETQSKTQNGAIIIEIEIFKKKFLPKYMSNTDLDQLTFDPWWSVSLQTAECPAILALAPDMASHVQLCPHGSSETLGY